MRKFKCTFPNLKESTVRSIPQKYEELRQALKRKRDLIKILNPAPGGTPLMLKKLDKMVQDYLGAVRRRGGVVSRSVAISVAKAFIKSHPEINLDHNIDLASQKTQKVFKHNLNLNDG